MNRRVVITGMGVVSPIGNDLPSFRASLKEARSGYGPIASFDTKNFPVRHAYEVKGFDPHRCRTHILDPFIQYAVAGTREALESASFQTEEVDPYRIGLSVSSSKGGVHTIERFKDKFERRRTAVLGARIYTNAVPNFAAQWIARRWKIKGPAKCYVAACATGTVSLIEGAQMVRDGVVDYCIAGASDASVVPLMLAGYDRMKALAHEKMRPFDRNRDGFLVGEGAGIVFMETVESAKARRAKIYGEILGFAYGNDCHDPVRFDDRDGALQKTIEAALRNSGVSTDELSYINLHGTGTKTGDLYETNQIKKAFGKAAYKIPMSSTKSMTGHMLGASGAVEAIASLLAIQDQSIPPTISLEKEDPQCDLNYTPNQAKQGKVEVVMSHSMGFGGHVAALVMGKA